MFYNTSIAFLKLFNPKPFFNFQKKWIILPFSTSTILPHFKCHTFLMGWWYSFSSNKMNNKWGIYYTHLREFWWWYFTYVCMYNIYVKWGEAFSLTHVQHRVIITTLLKWLTFAFDCPKNMNNNIMVSSSSFWSLFLGRGWRGFHAPSSPWQ